MSAALLVSRQRAFGLVELIIALALSLVVIAAVLHILLACKQLYMTNHALAQVQESARFALHFLRHDIRHAGYRGGCLQAPMDQGIADPLRRFEWPIRGWDGSDAAPVHLSGTPVENTDAVFFSFAAGSGTAVAQTGNAVDRSIVKLQSPSGLDKHSIALLSDALACDLFENLADGEALAISKGTSGNWSHVYDGELEILPLQNATYYIQANDGQANSLVRERLVSNGRAPAWQVEELVSGVQDMQLRYGLGDADLRVTAYVPAQEVVDWQKVIAVSIELLVISTYSHVAMGTQQVVFNGQTVSIADGRLAKVFSTTVGLRNRLP